MNLPAQQKALAKHRTYKANASKAEREGREEDQIHFLTLADYWWREYLRIKSDNITEAEDHE